MIQRAYHLLADKEESSPRNIEKTPAESSSKMAFCHLRNITECAFTEDNDEAFVANVYNPLARPVNKFVRVPVTKLGNVIVWLNIFES